MTDPNALALAKRAKLVNAPGRSPMAIEFWRRTALALGESVIRREEGVEPKANDCYLGCGNCNSPVRTCELYCTECGTRLKWPKGNGGVQL